MKNYIKRAYEKAKDYAKDSANYVSRQSAKLGLAAILGASAFLPGCSSIGRYMENRGNDFADIVKFKAGVGASAGIGARVKATDALWVSILGGDDVAYGINMNGRKFTLGNQSENYNPYFGFPGPLIGGLIERAKGREKPISSLSATDSEGLGWRVSYSTKIVVPSEEDREKLISEIPDRIMEVAMSAEKSSDEVKKMLKERIIVDKSVEEPMVRFYEDNFNLSRFLGTRNVYECPWGNFLREGKRNEFDRLNYFVNPNSEIVREVMDFRGTEKLPDRKPVNYADIEMQASVLGLNIGAGISPGEIVDAIGGLVGLDIAGDDK